MKYQIEETIKELPYNELVEKINLFQYELNRRNEIIKLKKDFDIKVKNIKTYSDLRCKLISDIENCDFLFPGMLDSNEIDIFCHNKNSYLPFRKFCSCMRVYSESCDFYNNNSNNGEVFNLDIAKISLRFREYRKSYKNNVEMCLCVYRFFYYFGSSSFDQLTHPSVYVSFCFAPKSEVRIKKHLFPFPY